MLNNDDALGSSAADQVFDSSSDGAAGVLLSTFLLVCLQNDSPYHHFTDRPLVSPEAKGSWSNMYAIIRSGGKQAKVSAGDIIDVELLNGVTGQVTFTPLLVVDESGTAVTGGPDLAQMQVTAKVLGDVKGKKVNVFKYKNKTGYRRRQGHRQRYTRLEIMNIGSAQSKEA